MCVSLCSGPTCPFLLPLNASYKPSDSSAFVLAVPGPTTTGFCIRSIPHSATSPTPDEVPGPLRPYPRHPFSPLDSCFPNTSGALFCLHTFIVPSLLYKLFPSTLPGIDLAFMDISPHKAGLPGGQAEALWQQQGPGPTQAAAPLGHTTLLVASRVVGLGAVTFPLCTLSFPTHRKG